MKTVNFIRLLSILLLWSLSCHAYAQQWYHVELVVFEQLDSYTDEKWPAMADLISAPLNPNISNNRIQPAKNNVLLNTANSLKKSARYQLHYHKSWLQPIMLKRSAQAIRIKSGDGMIDGSIKLYKATYLHAALDLWLMENDVRANSWSDVTPEGGNFNVPRNPNLVESRRIRSKKLYFFDHPKIGALLQLTPLKSPAGVETTETPATASE